jgi:hypothetical protein
MASVRARLRSSGAKRFECGGHFPDVAEVHLAQPQRALGRAGQIALAWHGHQQLLAVAAQQAFLFELAQAFADGRAVHAKAAGQLGLGGQDVTLLQAADDDAAPQIVRHHTVGGGELQLLDVEGHGREVDRWGRWRRWPSVAVPLHRP